MTIDLAPRPRRSALYMPASNPRAVEKARGLPCDVVILDLEDAVLPEAKIAARQAATKALVEGGFGRREVVVRINALETPWGADDLKAMSLARPDAVLAPKIRTPADVEAYHSALAATPASMSLWVMIETVQAVLDLGAIAASAATTRLAAMVMGMNDLAKEMGARQSPERAPFHWALAKAVTAARANGLTVFDSVHNEIDDLEALESVCKQGVEFGFDGKSLIHPSHLPICNRVFAPDAAELEWARAAIAAFAAPENLGKGALRVNGRLAEALHRDQAVRLLALAEAIRAADDAAP